MDEKDAQELVGTIRKYDAIFSDDLYDERDWARLGFASTLAMGSSVADIGVGPGAFVYHLADTGKFHRITALDIKRHSKLIPHGEVSYLEGDLRDPSLNIGKHDTVFCMEVIEHIESKYNPIMLRALRSTAAVRLVATVPYNEPEPLWWHDKPGGHRQRFDIETLAAFFPNAVGMLFPRYGVDWVFIIEDVRLRVHSFRIIDKIRVVEILQDLE